GTAEAAASALAAVRGAVLRQENALESANERRREAAEAREQIDDAEAPEGSAAEYSAAYEAAQRAATEAETDLEALRERLHSAEREAESLTAKAAALSSALSLSGGAAEVVRSEADGVRGLVGDAVQVTAGYEAAIAAVLGPLAEGVLVDDADAAFALATAGVGQHGVVDFVAADATRGSVELPEVPGVVAATSVVTAPDGILGVLSHVLIADDLDAARHARAALDALGDTSATIVTTGGDVITAQTLRTGA